MNKEQLTRCVVDTLKRTVYLYSNEGNERQVKCDTVDEFMNVLKFIRESGLDESVLTYVEP